MLLNTTGDNTYPIRKVIDPKIAYEMADRFFLVVADYNPDAKRFYERNGYQQVGKIPNLYRTGVTEYMMAKDLKK